jgi:hypothetical protein
VVAAVVAGAAVEATVVGATELDVAFAADPPLPHAANIVSATDTRRTRLLDIATR